MLLLTSATNNNNILNFPKDREQTQTPVAEVRGDDKEIGRVGQVFAKKFPIFLFFRLAQSSHQHRHDAEFIFMAVIEKRNPSLAMFQMRV